MEGKKTYLDGVPGGRLTSLRSRQIYLRTELFKYRDSAAPMADGGLGSPSPRLAGSVPGRSEKSDMALGAGGAKSKKTGAGSGEFAQVGEGSLKMISDDGVGRRQDGGQCAGGKFSDVCQDVLRPSPDT